MHRTQSCLNTTASNGNSPLKSILKSPSTPPRRQSNGGAGVHFGPPKNLEETLRASANDSLSHREELDGFITHMKNQKGCGLVDWLQRIQECLYLLNPSLETFVLAILNISWADQERPVVTAFKHFLTNLISAQSYYTKPVVRMLLMTMLGSKEQQEPMVTQLIFENAHEALRSVVRISPLASHASILSYGKSCMPFLASPSTLVHTNFISNLLKSTEYLPNERVAIMTLVIDRLVQLDANLPLGEDLYEDDDDDEILAERRKTREEICRDNLDASMVVLFGFVKNHVESLYEDLMKVFEANIMPSYATGHVQFLMFYMASLKPDSYPVQILEYFWKQFISPNCPSIVRQTAVGYIASFIARAKFIPVLQLRLYLKKITTWVHDYLNARLDVSGSDYNYVDVRAHGPFYAACQAVLYMLAFRYEELVQGPKSLDFLAKLGLGRMVTCSLNPLKVCLPPVVKNFATIARHYQLAYCETVIQRNNRLNLPVVGTISSTTSVIGNAKPALLDTFFPFDPYRLKESKRFIADHYREYQGSLDDNDEDSSDSDESDTEDNVMPTVAKRRRLNSSNGSISGFDYDGSPGFLKLDSI